MRHRRGEGEGGQRSRRRGQRRRVRSSVLSRPPPLPLDGLRCGGGAAGDGVGKEEGGRARRLAGRGGGGVRVRVWGEHYGAVWASVVEIGGGVAVAVGVGAVHFFV